jgi:DNA-binding transcriptional LysR family regulator
LRVRVDGQLTFNTSVAMIDAVLNGYGIAYVPEDLVAALSRLPHLLSQPPAEPAGLQGDRGRAAARFRTAVRDFVKTGDRAGAWRPGSRKPLIS